MFPGNVWRSRRPYSREKPRTVVSLPRAHVDCAQDLGRLPKGIFHVRARSAQQHKRASELRDIVVMLRRSSYAMKYPRRRDNQNLSDQLARPTPKQQTPKTRRENKNATHTAEGIWVFPSRDPLPFTFSESSGKQHKAQTTSLPPNTIDNPHGSVWMERTPAIKTPRQNPTTASTYLKRLNIVGSSNSMRQPLSHHNHVSASRGTRAKRTSGAPHARRNAQRT